jgi:hypothetical protein
VRAQREYQPLVGEVARHQLSSKGMRPPRPSGEMAASKFRPPAQMPVESALPVRLIDFGRVLIETNCRFSVTTRQR